MNNTAKSASQFALFLILFSTFASFSISALLLGLGADIEKAQLVLIIIQDIIIILIPVLIYCLVSRKKLTDIVPHNKLTLKNIGYITALTICFAPVMSLISALTTIFYPADVNSDVLTYIDKLSMPLVVLALGIMPAVFEELAFRGIILPQSRRAGFIASSLLSGLFFGLFREEGAAVEVWHRRPEGVRDGKSNAGRDESAEQLFHHGYSEQGMSDPATESLVGKTL